MANVQSCCYDNVMGMWASVGHSGSQGHIACRKEEHYDCLSIFDDLGKEA